MSVTHGSLIAPPNLPGWIQVPIRDLCARRFQRPLFLQNDANAAALAEFRFGSCRGCANLVYLTLSTGVGAGVLTGGRLLQGASDLGGEIGHHVLDRNGPPCPCGQRGCFEIYCGGLSVANRIRERIAAGAQSVLPTLAGGSCERIDFKRLVQAARSGDPLALEFWTEFIERLAQALGTAIMLYNPEAILLGTIAIHTGDFLLEPLRRALPRYCWPSSLAACRRIEASALGTTIGDLAALAIVLDHMERDNGICTGMP
jgi:glucokinase